MATKSANLYARIEPDVKEKAESILSTLGIPASSAINMFYKQIILQRGLPFEVKIPSAKPVDISTLSEAEFNEELEKGYDLKQSFIYDRLLFSYHTMSSTKNAAAHAASATVSRLLRRYAMISATTVPATPAAILSAE